MRICDGKVYVIAEIGGNFTSFADAKRLIDEAVDCGADAVKLQSYTARNISSKKAIFDMENTGIVSQFELFDKYSIGEDLHRDVFEYAKSRGLDVFSSPSHRQDVDMLERIGCDFYKIGSDDAVNIPLLKYIARLGKPIILATGMCTMQEVRESVNAILEEGNDKIAILHAVTVYPTHPEDVNLGAMKALQEEFKEFPVGYSDHTLGIDASLFAVAMGARIIEKHFTYDKNADGPDHMHSANPEEMKAIVDKIRLFEVMRGSGIKMPAKGEANTRVNNRKSLVLCRDLKAGELIGENDIDVKRPGYGIAPKYLNQVIGCRLNKNMSDDDVLDWSDLC